MTVLAGQLLQPAEGQVFNTHLTTDLAQFIWVNQFTPSPFATDTIALQQTGLVPHWPVEANGRPITAQAMRCFQHDYYYRIHVAPQVLDLGNVVSTQTLPVYVWNAHLEPKTLTAITGLDEGLELRDQPEPPLLFQPLQERVYQLAVTTEGSPVLDTRLVWQFSHGELPGLHVMARRIIAWSFIPDWSKGIQERLEWLTDVLSSETLAEQRRALRTSPRRSLSAPVLVEGLQRQRFDLALFGWGSRIWAVPIWPDIQIIRTPVALGATRIDCETADLDFFAGGLAMLQTQDGEAYEVLEVEALDATGLTLKRETQQAWPVGSRLYPARPALLKGQPDARRLTDTLMRAEVEFLVQEANDWPMLAVEALPQYRGWPVLEDRPDESTDLTHTLERLSTTLDSRTAKPLLSDIGRQPMPMTQWRWLELGRAARARYRSLLYTLNGRQHALWIPTHADDLTLAAIVVDTGLTLDVMNVGYSRFALNAVGRRHIRIQLRNGHIFYRQITSASELGPAHERLSIDQALGIQVAPEDVYRISWLVLSRGQSDSVEIDHLTDSEGVAAASLTFRGVRDDELQSV